MTSAALLIPADRPEPAIKANAAPGTNSTMGRTARSGRTPFPAPRRATPLVVGARVRRSPLRKGQNLAGSLRENANRAPALSHPSGASPRLDGIGARLSGFLPLLAAPRHLLMQDNRISPSNARLKSRVPSRRLSPAPIPDGGRG